MTSRFVLPLADVGSGITPQDGALLYFYDVGTSNPRTTWSDVLKTIPNTNPLVANANGVFGSIFFDGPADVTLTDKNSVAIWGPHTVYEFEDPTAASLGATLNPITIEEQNAGVTPLDTRYPATPYYDARRLGWSSSASATVNDAAVANALLVSHKIILPYDGDGIFDVSSSFTLGKYGQTIEGEAAGEGLGTASRGVVLNVVSGFPLTGGDAAQAVFNLTNRHQHIKNLTIDCNNLAQHGVYGTGGTVSFGSLEFITIIEPTDDGVEFGDSCWMFAFNHVRVTTGAAYGFRFNGSSGLTTLRFNNCYVSGTTTTGGFYLNDVTSFSMNACAVDSTTGYAFELVGLSQGTLDGCTCEQAEQLFNVASGSSLVVNGGRYINYGDDVSAPTTVINNSGSLTVLGVRFVATESYTAFLTTTSGSVTNWFGNIIRLDDETNVLANSCDIRADSYYRSSNTSAARERFRFESASDCRLILSEYNGGGTEDVSLTVSANKFRLQRVTRSDNQVQGTGIAFDLTNGTLGFFGAGTASRQTITGSTAGNVALQNLLTGLDALGLITDSTT